MTKLNTPPNFYPISDNTGQPAGPWKTFFTQIYDNITGQTQLNSYVLAKLPPAKTPGQLIYVSNATGGAAIAYSDGTNWRRVSNGAIVS